MRVAVHHQDGSVSAYKLGRIEDGVHNVHPVFGSMPIDEFIQELVDRAKKDFPDDEVVLERLVMHPDAVQDPETGEWDPDESIWVPADEFDPEEHTLTRGGGQLGAELSTQVMAEARTRDAAAEEADR